MDTALPSSAQAGSSQSRFERDEDYYFEDGSCVLLVQDTLFNVHRSILSRDSSSFGTMFSLPHGDKEAEGKSDTNPVVLVGDTVEEFKHFLWALYALPPELRLVTSSNAELTRLIDITCIANKYSFRTIEMWALDAIQEYVNQKPCPILGPLVVEASSGDVIPFPRESTTQTLQNTAQLTQLIRLAQLCHHDKLLNTLIALLKQLMGTSIHYAYLAMTIADEYDLRSLKGIAYLEVMQKSSIVSPFQTDPFPAPVFDNGSTGAAGNAVNTKLSKDTKEGRLTLSSSQRLRLLSGHYRLTIAWERLRVTPPQFAHTLSCGATWHQHGCTQSWLEFWKEKTKSDVVLSLGPADVLGRLKQLTKDFDRWGSATYMHHDCRVAARKSIQEAAKAIEDTLPDYFSDEAGLGLVL
ncbi:hypothetical protein BDN72DRAFT_765735 [Pluteus cervinus]|uniref:Uncharacterized protein n=1 Tax=Pluteus cervinus TaxID=181527 RepID=A0ACD3AYZ9_9AGAR|nr:hypothetical protein BDN72DRAFT_765735 [Pluteus cervinus]